MTGRQAQTSYLLDAHAGWRASAESSQVAAGATLRLAAEPKGPLGFQSPDGSLGGLGLPTGMAQDGKRRLYRLQGPRVLRYESGAEWQPLPVAHPGLGCDEPRPDWTAIASASGWLALATRDEAAVYEAEGFGMVARWTNDSVEGKSYIDLAAHDRTFYLLTEDGVYSAAAPLWRVALAIPKAPGYTWDRIICDRGGRVYLRRAGEAKVDVHGGTAAPAARQQPLTDPEEVRAAFRLPDARLVGGELRLSPAARLGRSTPRPDADEFVELEGNVYSIDFAQRTLTVWNRASGLIEAKWGPLDFDLREVPRFHSDAWEPADLGIDGGRILLLDRRHNRILAHTPGESALRVIAAASDETARWRRLAAAAKRCLVVYDSSDPEKPYRVFTRSGQLQAVLPSYVVAWPSATPFRTAPETDAQAMREYLAPDPRESLFVLAGGFYTQWLDSGIHNCVWHRLAFSGIQVPDGCAIEISTATANDKFQWPGPEGKPAASLPSAFDQSRRDLTVDTLVRSGPGRFLQVRVMLIGDRRQTPSIERIRAVYPRESVLDRLPAVFSEDPQGAEYLDRFLSIASEEWRRVEARLDEVSVWYDPERVPAGPPLERLANLLSVKLPSGWTTDRHRQLLIGAQRSLRRRGTPEGLRLALSAVLAAIRGVTADEVLRSGWPVLWERFQDRPNPLGQASLNQVVLAAENPLERFQFGVSDADSAYRMISPDRPEEDQQRIHSYRCRVLIPAGWIRDERELALVEETIRREMPAHLVAELEFVEPALRVGIQSKVGVDMVIAAPPASILPAIGPRLAADDTVLTLPLQDLGRGAPLG